MHGKTHSPAKILLSRLSPLDVKSDGREILEIDWSMRYYNFLLIILCGDIVVLLGVIPGVRYLYWRYLMMYRG